VIELAEVVRGRPWFAERGLNTPRLRAEGRPGLAGLTGARSLGRKFSGPRHSVGVFVYLCWFSLRWVRRGVAVRRRRSGHIAIRSRRSDFRDGVRKIQLDPSVSVEAQTNPFVGESLANVIGLTFVGEVAARRNDFHLALGGINQRFVVLMKAAGTGLVELRRTSLVE